MMIFALIPAYNEEDRIGATVEALRSRSLIDEIVVIDDGSRDKTAEAAKAAGAGHVLTLPRNGGKGAALTAAYRKFRLDADVFLLLDADLGSSAAESVKLLSPILRNEADMTVGLLPPDVSLDNSGSPGGGMGMVVRLARWGLKRRTGQVWSQPLSGQRAARRAVLDALGGEFAGGFGVEVGLTLAAVEKGFRLLEVPTAFRHRVGGNDWSSLAHRGRQFADVVRVLLAR